MEFDQILRTALEKVSNGSAGPLKEDEQDIIILLERQVRELKTSLHSSEMKVFEITNKHAGEMRKLEEDKAIVEERNAILEEQNKRYVTQYRIGENRLCSTKRDKKNLEGENKKLSQENKDLKKKVEKWKKAMQKFKKDAKKKEQDLVEAAR